MCTAFERECQDGTVLFSLIQWDLISTNGGKIANESTSAIFYQRKYPNGQIDQLMENSQEKQC